MSDQLGGSISSETKSAPRKTQAPKPATPLTIARLRSLGPGERMVWYRGNLTDDIADSGPRYRKLLYAVADEADKLAREGRLTLSSRKLRIPLPPDKDGKVRCVKVVEHFAIGARAVSSGGNEDDIPELLRREAVA
jgi:hypothetical protein